jgi:CRP-like cAMP-binding protein
MGALLAGLLLLLVTWGRVSLNILIPLGMLLALGYVAAAWKLRSEYGRALVKLLEEDEMAVFRTHRDDTTLTDPATLKLLTQRLDASPNAENTIFLAEMLYSLAGPAVLPRLHTLFEQSGPEVRTGILAMFGDDGAAEAGVRQICFAGLRDAHPAVRMAAVRVLVDTPTVPRDTELLDALCALLDGVDEEMQAHVLPPLLLSGMPAYAEPARQVLHAWLNDEPCSTRQERGLYVLARVGDAGLLPRLESHLHNAAPALRHRAVELLDELARHSHEADRPQAVATLRGLLTDTDEGVRLAVVHTLGVLPHSDATAALLDALDDTSFAVRQQACALVGTVAHKELDSALDSDNYLLAESATAVLAAESPRARKHVPTLVEELVRDAYTLSLHRLNLRAINTPSVRLLATRLHEQTDLLLERIFWLLGALNQHQQDTGAILRVLRSGSATEHTNALEALESLTSPHLARITAPLLNGTPLPELERIARDTLGMHRPTVWELLQHSWKGATHSPTRHLTSNLEYLYNDSWMVALALYALQENGLANLVGREPAAPAHEATRRAIRACAEHPIPLVRETALLVLAQQHQAGHHLTKEAQMLTTIEKLVFLKQVPFFQDMSIAQLHVLASISEEMDVAADETILSEGEYVDALYVLVSGRVALQRRQKRRQDSITRLATLGPRDYFAEMSVFDNEPLSADAVALEPTRLLLVRQSPLIALIKRHPEMGLALLKVLSQRLRQVDDRFAEKVKARPKKLVDLYDTLNDPKDTE